jgi:RNA-directed DNA polymerase
MRRESHVRFWEGGGVRLPSATRLVAGFERKADAERFLTDLRARLAQFALTLHPDKTRLIQFGRRAATDRKQAGLPKPETFAFLGFTHICGRSRRGGFLLVRRTRRDRRQARLRAIKAELRRRMHDPIPSQGRWLRQVARGYFAYHAVPTNHAALALFRSCVVTLWRRTLKRRGQRDHTTWHRITRIAEEWLPKPRILHPWPNRRFAVRHPRWEPDAVVPPVRFCAGGAQ